jgi:hypothetical protein
MQEPLVWLAEPSTQPDSADAERRLEHDSLETQGVSVSREPGWLGAWESAEPSMQRGEMDMQWLE